MPMSTASISLSSPTGSGRTNTDALNEMLKPVQHDKKKRVIPNLFRNLEFGNDNKSIAFALDRWEGAGRWNVLALITH